MSPPSNVEITHITKALLEVELLHSWTISSTNQTYNFKTIIKFSFLARYGTKIIFKTTFFLLREVFTYLYQFTCDTVKVQDGIKKRIINILFATTNKHSSNKIFFINAATLL